MPPKIIYVFGNPLLSFDNLPIKLMPKLQKEFPQIKFIAFDPNENLKPINKELFIIDTAQNIKNITIINNLNNIKIEKIYSLHDFDLAFNLKLLEKIEQLKKITIVVIPMNAQKQLFLKLKTVLSSIINK